MPQEAISKGLEPSRELQMAQSRCFSPPAPPSFSFSASGGRASLTVNQASGRNQAIGQAATDFNRWPKDMKLTERARLIVKRFSQEIEFYRLVLKHPRTPRASRFFLGAAIAYAVSPIDLIPDFIPVIGHLDDVIILPVLIWFALRLIPKDVIAECRNRVKENTSGQPPVAGTGLPRT